MGNWSKRIFAAAIAVLGIEICGVSAIAKAEATLSQRCFVIDSPARNETVVRCSSDGSGIFVSTMPMSDDIPWSNYTANINRDGTELGLSSVEGAPVLEILGSALSRCLVDACVLDNSISHDDISNMIEVLRSTDLQGWHVNNFIGTFLMTPAGEFNIFHSLASQFKVSFGYDPSSPVNQVEPYTAFEIFLWRE